MNICIFGHLLYGVIRKYNYIKLAILSKKGERNEKTFIPVSKMTSVFKSIIFQCSWYSQQELSDNCGLKVVGELYIPHL